MRRSVRFPLPAIVAALVASLLLAGTALAATTTLTASLADAGGGAAGGSGSAEITLDPDTGEVCWTLSVEGIGDVVASHIHVGAAGESGGVVVPLDVDGFSGTSDECDTPADADLDAIIANPAGYYVNIHTADYPGGAIRGQLAGAAPDTAMAPAAGIPFAALGAALLALGGLGVLREVRSRTRAR